MKPFVKGRKIRANNKIFRTIINRINHSIARKNIMTYPQLVIFSFDHIGLALNVEGRYENSILYLVEEFINQKLPAAKNSTVLDIGANIGNHSIFFAKMFKKVYAFEPNPVTYEVLKINCNFISETKNIEPFNFGLSDIDGTLPFLINHSNIGGSAIAKNEETSENIIDVSVKKLDDLTIMNNTTIALIKLDVEGHELKVLEGAKNTLSKNKPAILFEQHPSDIVNGSSDVVMFLQELGYDFFTIKKNFYFGGGILSKVAGLTLRTLLGEQFYFVEIKEFKKIFYDMILAVPKT